MCFCMPFNPQLRAINGSGILSAKFLLMGLSAEALGWLVMIFRFGCDRQGDFDYLQEVWWWAWF